VSVISGHIHIFARRSWTHLQASHCQPRYFLEYCRISGVIDVACEIRCVIRFTRHFVDAKRVGRGPLVITVDIANHPEVH
jgi:hypothetical protein